MAFKKQRKTKLFSHFPISLQKLLRSRIRIRKDPHHFGIRIKEKSGSLSRSALKFISWIRIRSISKCQSKMYGMLTYFSTFLKD
jgi:hypothetical protein